MRLRRDARTALLARIPLLADCSRAELEEVAGLAVEIDLKEGRQLTREGAEGHEFVVIIDGTAEVREHGRVVATMTDGDFFGEIALVTGSPRTATVVATSPVHALVLDERAFARLMADAPSIRTKVEQAVVERLHPDEDRSDV